MTDCTSYLILSVLFCWVWRADFYLKPSNVFMLFTHKTGCDFRVCVCVCAIHGLVHWVINGQVSP